MSQANTRSSRRPEFSSVSAVAFKASRTAGSALLAITGIGGRLIR
jgi:hypothetical protein